MIKRIPKEGAYDSTFDTTCSHAAGLHRGSFAKINRVIAGKVAISVADHARHDTMSASRESSQRHPILRCAGSMGGYIKLEMVRQSPDRIERLALLDTSALSDTPSRPNGASS